MNWNSTFVCAQIRSPQGVEIVSAGRWLPPPEDVYEFDTPIITSEGAL